MKRKAYITRYSQAVTHPSTNLALASLTAVIGREPVFSRWYGRRQDTVVASLVFYSRPTIISPTQNTVERRKHDSFQPKEAHMARSHCTRRQQARPSFIIASRPFG